VDELSHAVTGLQRHNRRFAEILRLPKKACHKIGTSGVYELAEIEIKPERIAGIVG
jgi:hypothetical protein